MILRVADDRYLAAVFADDFTFRDSVGRIIGAFCVKIGFDGPYQFLDGRLVKNGYKINATKRRRDLGSLVFGHVWTAHAL